MKLKRILSGILTLSIIATSFSSVVQISAQTEESASNQVAQVAVAEDSSVQTASRPADLNYEFVIDNKEKFFVFMTTPVL
ncbi:MAG: hypothetical protein K2G97_02060, partial [Oscillospiraceae bacterium]|nr:hypothetical protein [Oscillospiraceae bacterium]